jgi:hypothetical protein
VVQAVISGRLVRLKGQSNILYYHHDRRHQSKNFLPTSRDNSRETFFEAKQLTTSGVAIMGEGGGNCLLVGFVLEIN